MAAPGTETHAVGAAAVAETAVTQENEVRGVAAQGTETHAVDAAAVAERDRLSGVHL